MSEGCTASLVNSRDANAHAVRLMQGQEHLQSAVRCKKTNDFSLLTPRAMETAG